MKVQSPLWHSLSHRGPLFPVPLTQPLAPVTRLKTKCDPRDASAEAKAAIRRLVHLQKSASRNQTPRGERSLIEKRFWSSWYDLYMPPDCTFTHVPSHVPEPERQVMRRSPTSVREKHAYGIARVDGVDRAISNYKIEAPGVFAGRGPNHPLAGRVKRALRSENVTINISSGSRVPSASDGGRWAGVVHDNKASWLASWSDPISGKKKYMRLRDTSREDRSKFDKARHVASRLPALRQRLEKLLAHPNSNASQLVQHACCLLLIDTFALRVGAHAGGRAFGATTLRSKHVVLSKHHRIALSFIGKDSMTCVAEGKVSAPLTRWLSVLTAGASPESPLFNDITESTMNRFIGQELGAGITAQNIRTAQACVAYERCLEHPQMSRGPDATIETWRSTAMERLAVAKVAQLCNHRRMVDGTPDPIRERQMMNDALRLVATASKSILSQTVKDCCKGLNLATAPSNYIDPRITRSYEARHDLTRGSCSSKALHLKFEWADDTRPTFRFAVSKST